MKCPTCIDTTLALTTRENVEIDYCPQCRGVWLDRGELDKIIERTEGQSIPTEPPSPVPPRPRPATGSDHPYDDDDHDGWHQDRSRSKRRKKSFLSDMFDFD